MLGLIIVLLKAGTITEVCMADQKLVKDLDRKALDIRLKLLKLCEQTLIHIGGDYSVADFMTALWQYAIKYDEKNPRWEGRDRFILSKGHASAVTSFNQAMKGCYKDEEIFAEYCTDNGRFGMHSCNLINPYVDLSTGSLGHGLPVAIGTAQALRMKGNFTNRVYVVVGDGELDEGTMWEAAAAASHYKLGNLVVFVDHNKLSFDGPTKEVLNIGNIADRFRLSGWYTLEINGHDMNSIVDTLDNLPGPDSRMPIVIVADTVKGYGIDFMENNPAWHAGQIDNATRVKAESDMVAAYEMKWGEKYV